MKSVVSKCLLIAVIFFSFLPTSFAGNIVEVGIDEKLGSAIPLNASFYSESGKKVRLGSLVKKPAIISLAYYSCSNICNNVLSNIADVLGKLDAEALRDYSVITISFDEKDSSENAVHKKKNYLKAISKPFPENGWRFLTGDKENISKITRAIGFNYIKKGEQFNHPTALVVVSPSGKIIRYIYGEKFLPFDLKLALLEASEERVGASIPKALLFCYSYDPNKRTYVFNVLKIAGTVTLVFAAGFLMYLTKGKGQEK
ncbi:MAG: SCO family protein [Deltaproteobacteria bacterium]|nr:SCO family protein [Deltaproteobacteria bacterium]